MEFCHLFLATHCSTRSSLHAATVTQNDHTQLVLFRILRLEESLAPLPIMDRLGGKIVSTYPVNQRKLSNIAICSPLNTFLQRAIR